MTPAAAARRGQRTAGPHCVRTSSNAGRAAAAGGIPPAVSPFLDPHQPPIHQMLAGLLNHSLLGKYFDGYIGFGTDTTAAAAAAAAADDAAAAAAADAAA
eukprot:SAG22_NODE_14790_length_365_cov_0.548872_1_plen_99_part_10